MSDTTFASHFFNMLNDNQIEYCVFDIFPDAKQLDIFIRLDCNAQFIKLMESHGYKKHSSNTENYSFIYRLEPDIFWTSLDGTQVHSACQMHCASLSNLSKCMLPLDECIQKSLWSNKQWNKDYHCWMVCPEDYVIGKLAFCVFTQKEFDEQSISQIQSCNIDLTDESLIRKLEGVFFLFTPDIIRHIAENRFHEIIRNYRTFYRY